MCSVTWHNNGITQQPEHTVGAEHTTLCVYVSKLPGFVIWMTMVYELLKNDIVEVAKMIL